MFEAKQTDGSHNGYIIRHSLHCAKGVIKQMVNLLKPLLYNIKKIIFANKINNDRLKKKIGCYFKKN